MWIQDSVWKQTSFQLFVLTWHYFHSWNSFPHASLLLIYVGKSLHILHTQPGMGQFLLTLIEICGQEIHRADQVQGQVSESWRMYKHGKTKIMETCREQTECKRWHQSEEIRSDNEIWFAAKLNGNVYEIMEKVVVGFAEYSKKNISAYSGSAKIKIHKVLHDILYSSIWPKM